MPLLNWQALKSSQVAGTVFSELDDEHVLEVWPLPVSSYLFSTSMVSVQRQLRTEGCVVHTLHQVVAVLWPICCLTTANKPQKKEVM